jgi:hypothetical protein
MIHVIWHPSTNGLKQQSHLPLGLNAGLWDTQALAAIKTPLFYIAGSADDVSGYSPGIICLNPASIQGAICQRLKMPITAQAHRFPPRRNHGRQCRH